MERLLNTIAWPAIALLLLCFVSTAGARTICVDADAVGANDGSSWTDAYKYLQDALGDANSSEKPVEIRVAQGVYKPDRSTAAPNGTRNREATFRLISGVTVKGGYAGFGEPDPNARDITKHETILSGDLDGNDIDVNDPYDLFDEPSRAENSYHVVTGSGTDETAVLEGFTITNGYANGVELENQDRGGGVYTNSGGPTVMNCAVRGNYATVGGGMLNYLSSPILGGCTFSANEGYRGGGGMANLESHPILTGCTFAANSASGTHMAGSGGGMVNDQSSVTLEGCSFVRNTARGSGGGMVNYRGGNPMVANCTFIGNWADGAGGGMYNDGSNPMFLNCTFRENSAGFGGGAIAARGSSPRITNCIISGNTGVGNMALGGGILVLGCGNEPVISDCIITGNRAGRGGGICESTCTGGGLVTLRISHCVIGGNRAEGYGGGICCDSWGIIERCIITGNTARWGGGISGAGLELRSCTFSGNIAKESGGGVYKWASLTLSDSILWGDIPKEIHTGSNPTELGYCDLEGGWPGEGNINADPCFVAVGYWDPNGTPADANDDYFVEGDYHLKSQAGRWDPVSKQWVKDKVTSPCIDAGDPRSPIGYEPFPNGGRINMGAYGGTTEASKSYFGAPLCETIVAGDINGDCIVDIKDFAFMAGHWLADAERASNPNPPDGSVGIRTDPVLSWVEGIGATSHDVYLGTADPPSFRANQTGTTFSPGLLSNETTYYWRIDEVNPCGTTTGTVWSFTTGTGSPPR